MQRHESQRGYFGYELYQQMSLDPNIYVVVGDLGYGLFDDIKRDFPNRFINTGASEQSMMDIGVGLALAHKIPVVYSITTFLLYRAFETIRTYIDHEKIPVKLVGSGRDRDYKHDGFSHHSMRENERHIFQTLPNIKTFYPSDKEEITNEFVRKFLYSQEPCYINLRR